MSSHFWEIKNLHGKQVIATLDNRNSLPFETEEEQEEAREFFKKLEVNVILFYLLFETEEEQEKAREFFKKLEERENDERNN